MKQRIFKMISLGIKQFSDPYYQGFAAQLAFYYILSLTPMMLLISQIMGHFFQPTLDDAVGWILDHSEGVLADEIGNLLVYKSAGITNVLYLIISLWAASRAQFSMMRITNFTFSEGKSTGKGYFRDRFRAFRTMALTMVVIIIALVILAYGESVLRFISDDIRIWLVLRWPLAFGLYFIMISYIYFMLPTERVKYKEILPGSIFASIGLLVVTWVYSRYTSSIANYDIVYGSLGTLVALMFWFYFMAWVICLGVLVNKVWMDTGENT